MGGGNKDKKLYYYCRRLDRPREALSYREAQGFRPQASTAGWRPPLSKARVQPRGNSRSTERGGKGGCFQWERRAVDEDGKQGGLVPDEPSTCPDSTTRTMLSCSR